MSRKKIKQHHLFFLFSLVSLDSKTLQILGLFLEFAKPFLDSLGLSTLEKFKIALEKIVLTIGQNNYSNTIPLYIWLQ